ncbi:hypothetical protein ACJIZ3_006501 [Penstemon smallii]|uniref:Ribosomal protein L32 n=1 Tax=Penstemon smallii TaxID=265156 RepID=A0ABD3S7V8_9LAMI
MSHFLANTCKFKSIHIKFFIYREWLLEKRKKKNILLIRNKLMNKYNP